VKTREVTFEVGDLTMVLPGTWASIPLDDPVQAKSLVAALVKRQVGRDDRLARTRREVRQELEEVVARGHAAGAFQMALALEILPGIPFSAAMFLDYGTWRGDAPDAEAQADRLAELLPDGDLLPLEPGLAVRSWRQVDIRPGTETVPDTKLEYFLPTPDGSRLLHVTADAPVDCEPEMLVALFDTMIDSIRWIEEPVAHAE
jgi:hypothetical protein